MTDSVVVLVSGFLGPGIEWRGSPIRLEARSHGWEPRYFHRRLVFAGVDTNGERLAESAERLHRHFETIAVVGHSMGGLVAEHAASVGAPIDAIVTLGTPHRGVSVPPSLGAANQMREGSDYLYALQRSAPNTPTLAIAGSTDRFVTGERAFPPRPCERLIVKDCGHVRLIYSDRVTGYVFHWLNSRRPAFGRTNVGV